MPVRYRYLQAGQEAFEYLCKKIYIFMKCVAHEKDVFFYDIHLLRSTFFSKTVSFKLRARNLLSLFSISGEKRSILHTTTLYRFGTDSTPNFYTGDFFLSAIDSSRWLNTCVESRWFNNFFFCQTKTVPLNTIFHTGFFNTESIVRWKISTRQLLFCMFV